MLQRSTLEFRRQGAFVEPPENTAASKPPETEKPHILEWIVSTGLFLLLCLLVSNVCVLVVARHSNDDACKAALTGARKAQQEGQGREAVMQAALLGVQTCSPSSALISHPEFVEFKDYRLRGRRAFRIRTRALARVPAPFLMPNAPFNQDGQLSVSRTYELEVEPARAGRAGS
jgi:hypothetical protein